MASARAAQANPLAQCHRSAPAAAGSCSSLQGPPLQLHYSSASQSAPGTDSDRSKASCMAIGSAEVAAGRSHQAEFEFIRLQS